MPTESNPAPVFEVEPFIGISFDMTHTKALALAEDISFVADSLRDDLATHDDIPIQTQRILLGALGLIAHAANTLTEFVGEAAVQGGCSHE